MDERIRQALEEEYRKTLERVAHATTGSDEAKWQLQKLAELHKQILDAIQVDNKCRVERRRLEIDEEDSKLKARQVDDGKKTGIIKLVIDGIGIILSFAGPWVWLSRGLQFESTGCFTSRAANWVSTFTKIFKK